MRKDLLLEEARRDALADEAPLGVGEGHDHGVDLVGRDRGVQLRDAEVPWHPTPSLALCDRAWRARAVGARRVHCNHEVRFKGRQNPPLGITIMRKAPLAAPHPNARRIDVTVAQ